MDQATAPFSAASIVMAVPPLPRRPAPRPTAAGPRTPEVLQSWCRATGPAVGLGVEPRPADPHFVDANSTPPHPTAYHEIFYENRWRNEMATQTALAAENDTVGWRFDN